MPNNQHIKQIRPGYLTGARSGKILNVRQL